NSGRMLINLKPLSQRSARAEEVIHNLQTRLADVEGITLYMQPVQDLTIEDRVSRTQYQFTVEDANPDELSLWVPRIVDRLRQLPQLADVASDLQNGGLQVFVDIDRATASRFGITPAAVDNALYNAFGQRLVSTIFTQTNQYRVVLEVKPEFQHGPEALAQIYVSTVSPAASSAAFRGSLANELWLILAAIITMYIVLGVLYESYIHPITILSTLPSAGVGALLALMISRHDLGVIAIIGIVLLIGIVKKNAIMM